MWWPGEVLCPNEEEQAGYDYMMGIAPYVWKTHPPAVSFVVAQLAGSALLAGDFH